ncbi:MAG: class 1 isoprenoid biosynthesis enzyme [Anaerolineae bacterium]|nr:class 1 isoprenoid biosynthesis enzyme [Anaerolineae bacterium]
MREYVERVYDIILESLDPSAADGPVALHELSTGLFRDLAASVAGQRLPWLSLPILTCEALGGDVAAACYVAAAWEVSYRAAGYLDEWQDHDTDDALWRTIGPEKTASLVVGLVLISHSIVHRLQELGNVPDATILKVSDEFSRAALETAAGQDADLSGNLSLEDYPVVAAAKTGAQWGLATRAGALIAGADPEILDRYGEFGRAVLAEKCHPCRDQPLPPLGYPFGGPNATGLAPLRPIPLVQGLLNSPSEGDLQYLWPAELLLGVCIKQRVRTFSIESWRGERFGCILQRGHQMVAGKKLATD